MTYGVNVYNTSRKLALTSQGTLYSLLNKQTISSIGEWEEPLAHSFTVVSVLPPLVFIRCDTPFVAWSVPTITNTGGNSWSVYFERSHHQITTDRDIRSDSCEFYVYTFGLKPGGDRPTAYGLVLGQGHVTGTPLVVDDHFMLDPNSEERMNLPEGIGRGTSYTPSTLSPAVCCGVWLNRDNLTDYTTDDSSRISIGRMSGDTYTTLTAHLPAPTGSELPPACDPDDPDCEEPPAPPSTPKHFPGYLGVWFIDTNRYE